MQPECCTGKGRTVRRHSLRLFLCLGVLGATVTAKLEQQRHGGADTVLCKLLGLESCQAMNLNQTTWCCCNLFRRECLRDRAAEAGGPAGGTVSQHGGRKALCK
jgi:hypothetical protein